MANYYGQFRSNYFQVKDAAAFSAWADSIGVSAHKGELGWCLHCSPHSDAGSIPSYQYVPEDVSTEQLKQMGWTDDEIDEGAREIEFLNELSTHLAEGEVAVVMETGAEKLRYLIGYAAAVNHKGETVDVALTDIYKKARETFGKEPTRAEY